MSTKIVRDDAKTQELESRHAAVQEQINQLPEEKRNEIRAMQAEVDSEIAKVNSDMDAQFDIEAKWRNASGLHHADAEQVIRAMKREPIGKIKGMYGKQWVLTPFNTVVESQVYVNVLQERMIALSSTPAEITIAQLTEQRAQLIGALKEFTNLSVLDLIKLTFNKFFKRGN